MRVLQDGRLVCCVCVAASLSVCQSVSQSVSQSLLDTLSLEYDKNSLFIALRMKRVCNIQHDRTLPKLHTGEIIGLVKSHERKFTLFRKERCCNYVTMNRQCTE
jgi:hypothetical protein